MSVLEIITDPNPLLYQKSEVVAFPLSAELQRLISNMFETVAAKGYKGSGGLSAVQVGVLQRIAVVILPDGTKLLYINPEVLSQSGGKDKAWESCYSVPNKRGRVKRYKKIEVRHFDATGEEVKRELSGFDARVFLHEVDHMNGVLWTDLVESEEDVMSESEWLQLRSKGQ